MTREERAAQVRAERKAREREARRSAQGNRKRANSRAEEPAGSSAADNPARTERVRKATKGRKFNRLHIPGKLGYMLDGLNRTQRLLVFFIVAILIVNGFAFAGRYYRISTEHKTLVEQNEALKEQKNDVETELKNANTREYIQEQARKKLRLLNKDERIFIFKEDKKNDSKKKN